MKKLAILFFIGLGVWVCQKELITAERRPFQVLPGKGQVVGRVVLELENRV